MEDAANILITGASSGIGAALAQAYARDGVRLHLWGRDTARLAGVAEACTARGAVCTTAAFDVCDTNRLVAEIRALTDAFPIDLAILNAGLGGSLPAGTVGQECESALRMCTVNFTVPVLAANLLADAMAARACGRIVLIGSIAAQFPLPMAPAYSASKAGLAVFADALRLRLAPHGVGVSLVSPGFVDTPMSRSLREPRPFLIDADRAAAILVHKIARGRSCIVVPWQFAWVSALAGVLPRRFLLTILSVMARRLSV